MAETSPQIKVRSFLFVRTFTLGSSCEVAGRFESFPDTTLSPRGTSCSATDISDSGLGGSLNVRTLDQREKVKNKTFSAAFHQVCFESSTSRCTLRSH